MLYLIATPIGNLGDITYRAIQTLKTVDYVLCEDTRHSKILLDHYAIHAKLLSYHKFNESKSLNSIISDLKNGQNIALISDAGTPAIADPGENLVKEAIKENIIVIPIPGPCAAIAAITASGLNTTQFQFVGFLPKKTQELENALKQYLAYSGTTICYESPNRIISVLQTLVKLGSTRKLAVGRELTKKFEEVVRGTAQEIMTYFEKSQVKGEIVLMIAQSCASEDHINWEALTPLEHVELVQNTFQSTRQEAILIVARLRGISKSKIYNAVHKEEGDN